MLQDFFYISKNRWREKWSTVALVLPKVYECGGEKRGERERRKRDGEDIFENGWEYVAFVQSTKPFNFSLSLTINVSTSAFRNFVSLYIFFRLVYGLWCLCFWLYVCCFLFLPLRKSIPESIETMFLGIDSYLYPIWIQSATPSMTKFLKKKPVSFHVWVSSHSIPAKKKTQITSEWAIFSSLNAAFAHKYFRNYPL